jgi:serine protease inhibitor
MKSTVGKLGAALAVALMAGSACVSAGEEKEAAKPASEQAKELAVADNNFGMKLFKQLHKEGENRLISPTSIAVCMQMASQAAGGDTRVEMDQAMELGTLDAKTANRDLIDELNTTDDVKLSVANSLWADPTRVTLNEAYVKEVDEYFDSVARAIDFNDLKSVDVINGWISDKTNKLITDMLDEIPSSAITYLINAIYFKGDWTDKFDKEQTKDADFHLADGSTKTVKLMSRKDEIVYGEDTAAQFAKLPYGKDERVAMWVVLPKEGTSLDAVIKGLDAAKLKQWKDNAWERRGTIKLPRFKLRYKETLNDSLQAVGIKKAFKLGEADFTRLGESHLGKIFIGRVLHEAVVIVDEEGTEAAAATIVEMRAGSAPPKPFSMTCDKPFLFFIADERTGAVLFVGTCYNPADPDEK